MVKRIALSNNIMTTDINLNNNKVVVVDYLGNKLASKNTLIFKDINKALEYYTMCKDFNISQGFKILF